MINALEYKSGNIQVKIDGHRHVFESAKSFVRTRTFKKIIDSKPVGVEEEFTDKIPESDVSNEIPIVKAAFNAIAKLTTRSEWTAKFNEKTGLVKWQGQIITPETDLTSLPEDIAAFCLAIRTTDTIATYDALKPVEFETDDVPSSRIEMIAGEPVLVNKVNKVIRTKRTRVKNEDGTPAFDNGEPLFAEVPIQKK